MGTNQPQRDWDIEDLHTELEKFEQELISARLKPASVETYVGRTRVFLRWLAGDYRPRGPNA